MVKVLVRVTVVVFTIVLVEVTAELEEGEEGVGAAELDVDETCELVGDEVGVMDRVVEVRDVELLYHGG